MPLDRLVRRAFATQASLSDADVRRGQRMLMANGVCALSAGALQGGVFLTAFAVAIGASNYEIGLLASIGLIAQLMQLPGFALVQRFGMRRGITLVCAGISRLTWLFVIAIPMLFAGEGVSFLILWLLVANLVMSICNPAWNSLLRDVVPSASYGRFFSRRLALGTAAGLTLTLAGGWFVDWWAAQVPEQALYAYSMLFFLGLLFGLAELVAIARLPEPTMVRDPGVPLLEVLSLPWKDANFRQLLGYIGVWTFAVNMSTPFFIIYMLERIGVSVFLVTVLTMVSQLTNIAFLPIWGRLADRFSNKAVLGVSGPVFLVAIVGWVFTTLPDPHELTVPLLFLIHVLSGVGMAGVALGATNISLKLSPSGTAHAYMTVFGLAGALTGAVAPVLGGVLADFFALRSLSLEINWTEPAKQLSIHALHLDALDFLFVLATLIGFYSLNKLARVHEEGQILEEDVGAALVSEVVNPLRSLSSVAGIRRLAVMPVHTLRRGLRRNGDRADAADASATTAPRDRAAAAGTEGKD